MKIQNFRVHDPSQNGKGLSNGGAMEKQIWDESAGDLDHLRRRAEFIRRTVKLASDPLAETSTD